ncbi:MAG: Prolyl-tRNA synthetase [Candidatus Bipolaricaulis sibiricus]|uniref:Proline--tRNA ligase n=1 Tax=Bipolaricaulis sibiricus TaxID=2501609 RepID=A0A410FU90_BIPS1|nr:MAG: Prolyl-tRNA synthetase [Candidatus Bipolaricaulis sibiricus]
MPCVRWSRYFLPTWKEEPAEADLASHRLSLRAGLIRALAAGIYTYLPLGWRALRKIEAIVREEMDAIGGAELHMPVVHPAELWARTGRLVDAGEILVRFQDRAGRDMVLGPTHEEVVTDLARREVQSWRQLPFMLYQIQTKFRDEPRARGGLIRVREFTMKDGYSFHENIADLDRYYPEVYRAYLTIFRRCGLSPVPVEADPGLMGGSGSHEFMLVSDHGEDTFVLCSGCGYSANREGAVAAKESGPDEAPRPREEVATPGCHTIEAVARALGVPRQKTAKAVFYRAADRLVFVVIRGDLEVNEAKLARVIGVAELVPATEEEITAVGAVPGFASPIGISARGVLVVVDDSIPAARNLVAGANREGFHVRNVNFPRDFQAQIVADVALARDGDRCLRCGGELRVQRGIELGHIFKLGTKYSQALGATFLDRDGQAQPLVMGCYGIGIGRLLAAVLEAHHDDAGIVWPVSVAPFHVLVTVLNPREEEPLGFALGVAEHLSRTGLDVLVDDRERSPGEKFHDAKLIGIPVLAVVGPRSLGKGQVDLERRRDGARTAAPAAPEAIEHAVRDLLRAERG